MFLTMVTVNIVLIMILRKQNKILQEDFFYKEQCVIATVLVFFGFSYLSRFFFLEFYLNYYFEDKENKNMFAYWMTFDSVFLVDGVSFAALLIFHYKNFRP